MKLAIIFFACIISGRVYAGNINVDTIIVQNDTSICAGNSLTLSLNYPAITGRSIFPPGSDFEYSFDMPSAGWTTQMGGWPVGGAPFGNVTDGEILRNLIIILTGKPMSLIILMAMTCM
jgi:hypothetical protein